MPDTRRTMIREFIDARGEATVAELTQLCGDCSAMTLWRDLNRLEQEGAIRRTRGGAISMQLIQPDTEGLYSARARENIAAKRAIARAAAEFVQPGHSIYLDAGSTMMELAKKLPNHHFTVVTSGANIAIELSQRRACNVLTVGGQINANTLSCSGPQAESFLDFINIDIALMATSGYSEKTGFTSGDFSEQELKRKVVLKANKVIMLMDSTKIGRSLPFTFAHLSELDILVTDAPLPPDMQKAAKEAGVQVIVAEE